MKKILFLTLTIVYACSLQTTKKDNILQNDISSEELEKGLSFFITSRSLGNGADLGGLAGADQHCKNLATDVEKGE